MTFSMPSAARNLTSHTPAASPPLDAHESPRLPDFASGFTSVRLFIAGNSFLYTSAIERTPSASGFSSPIPVFSANTFAGQGEIKNMPISSFFTPFFTASSLARFMAMSTGAFIGSNLSASEWNLTSMSSSTAGHAVEIIGRCWYL